MGVSGGGPGTLDAFLASGLRPPKRIVKTCMLSFSDLQHLLREMKLNTSMYGIGYIFRIVSGTSRVTPSSFKIVQDGSQMTQGGSQSYGVVELEGLQG